MTIHICTEISIFPPFNVAYRLHMIYRFINITLITLVQGIGSDKFNDFESVKGKNVI